MERMTVSTGPEAEQLAKQYCGEGPLPDGSTIVGTVKWQGREGALVKAEKNFYWRGCGGPLLNAAQDFYVLVIQREYWVLDHDHVLEALEEAAGAAREGA
jgi:hypothetical protein